jgi:hypothetical protein
MVRMRRERGWGTFEEKEREEVCEKVRQPNKIIKGKNPDQSAASNSIVQIRHLVEPMQEPSIKVDRSLSSVATCYIL